MASDSSDLCPESSPGNPNKRFKTMNFENSPPPPLPVPQSESQFSSSKGKAIVETETQIDVCGICLAEAAQDGNSAIRGYVNSCDHYFCSVCIMEWAKVESKCPLCKRRFSTIRRPPKPPIFPSERIVHVPERNQVYHFSGNGTMVPLKYFLDVKCCVCSSSKDECLLLLCDLCDSASHTYCVGLGAIVPEGDWFCQDCAFLKAEHARSETDSNSSDPGNFSKSSSEQVSVFDIVREPSIREVGRSSSQRLVNAIVNEETSSEDNRSGVDSGRQASVLQDATKLNARTLWRQRNVHSRIQTLRDNWNNYRSGSLSFSSSNLDSGSSIDQTSKVDAHSDQSLSSACLSQELKADGGPPRAILNSGFHEINKAWKMMDIAKSIGQSRETKSILPQPSRSRMNSKNPSLYSQKLGSMTVPSIGQEKHYHYTNLRKDSQKHESLMLERQGLSLQGFQTGSMGFPNSPSPVYIKLPSSQFAQSCLQYDSRVGNGSAQKIGLGAPFSASNGCSNSVCPSSSVEPVPAASNLFNAKLEFHACFSCKTEPPMDKGAKEEGPTGIQTKQKGDAKSEIQSLVKLNLKLLTKDKKLEVSVFKEVARLATHSILAACSLEPPKPGIHRFPSSVCCHASNGLLVRRSALMPNSCRECFYAFVKDVVNNTLLEKRGNVDVS